MGSPQKLRKITVLLPENLIERATEASGAGLTPTLRQSLQEFIDRHATQRLRAIRGKVKFSIDFDALRRDFEEE